MFERFIEKAKDIISNNAPYDDDRYDDGYNEEEYFDEYDYAEPEPQPQPKVTSINLAKTRKTTPSSGKVVNINANVSMQMQVAVLYPTSIDDAEAICKDMQDKKTVVVNLENTDIEVAQRISDFLCGAGFALEGNIQAISDEIIMICPHNVKITGKLKQELAASGIKFPKSAIGR